MLSGDLMKYFGKPERKTRVGKQKQENKITQKWRRQKIIIVGIIQDKLLLLLK